MRNLKPETMGLWVYPHASARQIYQKLVKKSRTYMYMTLKWFCIKMCIAWFYFYDQIGFRISHKKIFISYMCPCMRLIPLYSCQPSLFFVYWVMRNWACIRQPRSLKAKQCGLRSSLAIHAHKLNFPGTETGDLMGYILRKPLMYKKGKSNGSNIRTALVQVLKLFCVRD